MKESLGRRAPSSSTFFAVAGGSVHEAFDVKQCQKLFICAFSCVFTVSVEKLRTVVVPDLNPKAVWGTAVLLAVKLVIYCGCKRQVCEVAIGSV